jgi:hypothetical protein
MPNKEVKIHLKDVSGLPLCIRDSYMKYSLGIHYELTIKFKEVTCRSCKAAISKLSRVHGYASA